ncbi:M15 family metallopeptidase [Thermodesulfobacteriota bacterium]
MMRRPFFVFTLLTLVWGAGILVYTGTAGTVNDLIVDSNMTFEEAVLKTTPPLVPRNILNQQELVGVTYYGFDNKIHSGQIVVDKRLVDDVVKVFQKALEEKFPIFSVIPISLHRFNWDDNKSMAANNTSGFNYRKITGGTSLSKHAYGFAVDLNPLLNPYVKGSTILPPEATYHPGRKGTLTPDSPIVAEFLKLGWTWGGNWETLKDYQHFHKIPEGAIL